MLLWIIVSAIFEVIHLHNLNFTNIQIAINMLYHCLREGEDFKYFLKFVNYVTANSEMYVKYANAVKNLHMITNFTNGSLEVITICTLVDLFEKSTMLFSKSQNSTLENPRGIKSIST